MENDVELTKMQYEDKVRCANFILEMLQKYMADVKDDLNNKKSKGMGWKFLALLSTYKYCKARHNVFEIRR